MKSKRLQNIILVRKSGKMVEKTANSLKDFSKNIRNHFKSITDLMLSQRVVDMFEYYICFKLPIKIQGVKTINVMNTFYRLIIK